MKKLMCLGALLLSACGSEELDFDTSVEGLGTPFYPVGTVNSAGEWTRAWGGSAACTPTHLNSNTIGCASSDGGLSMTLSGDVTGMADGWTEFTHIGFGIHFCRHSGTGAAEGSIQYRVHLNNGVYTSWTSIPVSTTAACTNETTRDYEFRFVQWLGQTTIVHPTDVIQLRITDSLADGGERLAVYKPVFQGIYNPIVP